jgi:hypothetical protein
MRNNAFSPGSRIRVTSYGPFRELKGTILRVDTIADDPDEPFCFYLVALDGTVMQEPLWFEYQEVELVGFPPLATPQLPTESTSRELVET